MRIAFAGGGTGGHLFPGLSVAEELRRRDPEGRILFLCTERDECYDGLKAPGIEAAVVPWDGRGSLLKRVATLLPAMARAMRVLGRFRPHVVVGLGGYGSVAPVACARFLRIPSVLLEQNVVPGRANRWLSRLADEVACQWQESAEFFRCKHKVRVTGNPIRSGIRRLDRASAAATLGMDPAAPTLLVMGGSQGARPLNDLLIAALPFFESEHAKVQFVHLAGRPDVERVSVAYEQYGARAKVLGFLDDMSLAYSVCDLALSRAGGTSIAELTALGIPSILIPYPHATDNHQYLNARVLEYQGGSVLLDQATLSPRWLAYRIIELLGDPARLAYMARQSSQFGVPRAASIVADRIVALGDGSHRPRHWPMRRALAGGGPP
jgi:UDP-N-acetylglucosamine--N-acetylmuramyl-(pentapeptide) pyrophosphoryl-undecaprenol N-acetylglucosamine transferase